MMIGSLWFQIRRTQTVFITKSKVFQFFDILYYKYHITYDDFFNSFCIKKLFMQLFRLSDLKITKNIDFDKIFI